MGWIKLHKKNFIKLHYGDFIKKVVMGCM